MKNIKVLVFVVLLVMSLAVFAGCNHDSPEGDVAATSESSTVNTEAELASSSDNLPKDTGDNQEDGDFAADEDDLEIMTNPQSGNKDSESDKQDTPSDNKGNNDSGKNDSDTDAVIPAPGSGGSDSEKIELPFIPAN